MSAATGDERTHQQIRDSLELPGIDIPGYVKKHVKWLADYAEDEEKEGARLIKGSETIYDKHPSVIQWTSEESKPILVAHPDPNKAPQTRSPLFYFSSRFGSLDGTKDKEGMHLVHIVVFCSMDKDFEGPIENLRSIILQLLSHHEKGNDMPPIKLLPEDEENAKLPIEGGNEEKKARGLIGIIRSICRAFPDKGTNCYRVRFMFDCLDYYQSDRFSKVADIVFPKLADLTKTRAQPDLRWPKLKIGFTFHQADSFKWFVKEDCIMISDIPG